MIIIFIPSKNFLNVIKMLDLKYNIWSEIIYICIFLLLMLLLLMLLLLVMHILKIVSLMAHYSIHIIVVKI